nr:substrate-binding domain-containing protein [Sporomusa silvacetica]
MFHAGSLSEPLRQLAQYFEKQHPGVSIHMEGSGARQAVRKVTDQGRLCDIVASADYQVIENLMKPDYARFNILFAGNQLVLSFTDKSKFAGEINQDNWFEILLREGVVYGHTDPELDPAGYRARLCWQLAERHYKVAGLYQQLLSKITTTNILTDRETIRAMLMAGELDYFFGYESTARQNGYQFVSLPTAINFSSAEYKDNYQQAEIQLSGKKTGTWMTVKGEPIMYGITLVEGAPNQELALAFLEFLLASGAPCLKKAGLIYFPPKVLASDFTCLPDRLRRFFPNECSLR